MIQIRDITKSYFMGNQTLPILKGVSLTIEDGDFVAIMGPSGSGKSTLMNILGLLDVPTTGSYLFNGKEISKQTEDELAAIRRVEIGFVFQQFNLLPRMSAEENVALPLIYSQKTTESLRPKQLLQQVGLGERIGHHTNELSGGQQQRVAIARSLVNNPKMILADEPTGNLDSVSTTEIMKTLKDLNAQGITIILVTHEEDIGAEAHRLIRMKDGIIFSDERKTPLVPQKKQPTINVDQNESKFSLAEIGSHFQQGFRTLAANKVRTALSMLGILIGVAAVVAMLALGKGAQQQIESQLSSLGSNLLVLRAGAIRIGGVAQESGATTRLSEDDAKALADNISTLKHVAPQVTGRGQITYASKNWSTQVLGTESPYAQMHASEPTKGRFFTNQESQTRARVAVIGTVLVKELFEDRNPIGEMIKINKVSFQVIGVLPEKGGGGFRNQDDTIIIPLSTAMHRLLGKLYVDSIELEVDKPENIDASQTSILAVMNQRHKVPESIQDEAFQILNLADIQAALSKTSQTMSLLLAVIAGISLVVGGIGIMNIMLVSVTERTREIGLRKAIGAKRKDILLQFLVESVVVSAIGGLSGILLGWLITVGLSAASGWSTSVSIESVMLSFFTSALIGVVFGVYPARKASLLNPIDALRFE
ncbi:MAG: ABC transporter permease [Bdellovibrio sp.]|nr:ABC transporter permease [Bdellovibrio sp.]